MMDREREKFRAYEAVRLIGAYNMITESPKVISFISIIYGLTISKEDYISIIGNYSDLKDKYL